VAAATVAGALSLADGAAVIALRSRALMSVAGRGGMLSVAEPAQAVRQRIAGFGGRLSVAVVNSPAATVVSGDLDALEELQAACAAAGVRTRRVPISYASHSRQVEAAREGMLRSLDGISPGPLKVPMISAVTGQWLEGPELDGGYWYAALRSPVEFQRSVRVLAAGGHGAFIEVSPHPVLTTAVTETLEDAAGQAAGDAGGPAVVVGGTLRRGDGGPARMMRSLAGAFTGGVAVDWAAVLGGGQQVGLPTYAFQHQRYWPRPSQVPAPGAGGSAAEARFWAAVEGGDVAALAGALGVNGSQGLGELVPALASWRRREQDESATARWRYRVSWAPTAVPPTQLTGRWLLVVPAVAGAAGAGPDEAGAIRRLSERVAAVLAGGGADVVVAPVPPGAPGRALLAERIRALLTPPGSAPGGEGAAAGPGDDRALAGVVSLMALDDEPVPGTPAVPAGLAGTTALIQALGDAGVTAPLWAVTQGAVAAAPGETASAVQAMTWGLGRAAALEYPERWGGLVDLPAELDERAGRLLCAVLAGCGEDQAAIRAAGILGRRLVQAPMPRRDLGTWTPTGAVLITGGTGAVGGHVARWAAGRGARRIVLAGRSGPAAPRAAELAATLAAAGSAVTVTACDMADREQVAALLGWIDASGPPLSSVLHAAAAQEDGPIAELTVEGLGAALGAKAVGAAHLDELTAGHGLDAFVLFASGAGVWGGAGQGGYAAANAFLDGLATARQARGLAATSVAWGLWGGGGMGTGKSGVQLQRLGLKEMDPGLAVRALAAAVDGQETLVTVTDVDWARFAPVFTLRRTSPLLTGLPAAAQALAAGNSSAGEAAESTLARELAGKAAADQERVLASLVRAEVAAVLGHASPEAIPAGRPFRDLGFDSLTAVELRDRLRVATRLRLPATMVFDHPTPAAVARYLRAEICPDEAPGKAPVFLELDQLESILSALPAESDMRTEVTRRLRAVLSKWIGAQEETNGDAVAGTLQAATADELFSFIENEFEES
jgi:malonyl CoA-acyl carrier protein transacylase/short-subunit dehydrogenase